MTRIHLDIHNDSKLYFTIDHAIRQAFNVIQITNSHIADIIISNKYPQIQRDNYIYICDNEEQRSAINHYNPWIITSSSHCLDIEHNCNRILYCGLVDDMVD